MKDMLQVNGEAGSVLFDARIDQEYDALRLRDRVDRAGLLRVQGDGRLRRQEPDQVEDASRSRTSTGSAARPSGTQFTEEIGNQRLLFHGSRIQNWVGILSRGILLPKIVVSMGVNRTDAGWLGHGIYFGDAACTSVFYTTPGKKKTRLMAIARVALGKMKDYTKITYGLTAPPEGYDSCHGVRARRCGRRSSPTTSTSSTTRGSSGWSTSSSSRPEPGRRVAIAAIRSGGCPCW